MAKPKVKKGIVAASVAVATLVGIVFSVPSTDRTKHQEQNKVLLMQKEVLTFEEYYDYIGLLNETMEVDGRFFTVDADLDIQAHKRMMKSTRLSPASKVKRDAIKHKFHNLEQYDKRTKTIRKEVVPK